MPVTDLGDTDGWTAEPIDHDPFAGVPDSSITGDRNRDFGPSRFAGHVAASPESGQVFTPKYLAARPEGSLSSYDPSWSERLQQGVSETAQRAGVPAVGAERMGSAVRQGAEFAPVTGNILQGNEAYRSAQAGDPWGAVLHGAMAVPIPGASTEEAAARRLTPLGFYSHGAHVAENLPQQVGTTGQMVAQLGKAGVKPAELEGAGLNDLSDMPPRITRDELADMFHRNLPPLQETVLGGNRRPSDIEAEARRLYETDPYWREHGYGFEGGWDEEHPDVRTSYRELAEQGLAQPTRFGEYTLPGGQNYREVLMHLPMDPNDAVLDVAKRNMAARGIDWNTLEPFAQSRAIGEARDEVPNPNFDSAHWNVPNVVAHLRFNDRTGENGEKLLHMEELQSDWGQRGRDEGISQPIPTFQYRNRTSGFTSPVFRTAADARDYFDNLPPNLQPNLQLITGSQRGPGVPAGPYIGSTAAWTDLGLKRALIEAAQGGYSHLSWTPGQDQAERYALSKHVSDLSYAPASGQLQARLIGGGRGLDKVRVPPGELSNYVGRDVAEKLLATPQGQHFNVAGMGGVDHAPQWTLNGWHTLSGQDLHIGGEGMKGYYDKIVPTQLSKIAKRLDPDAKLGTVKVPSLPRESVSDKYVPGGRTFPSLEITPLMRQRILQGLPQYRRGGRVGFADGGASEDPLGYSVTLAHPQLEPVDHNPFPETPKVEQSDINRAKGLPEPRSPMHDRIAAASQDEPPRIMGHVAAEPVPGQVFTPKYLAERPQGSISSYDPSMAERLQQGVSESAQSVGVPVQGAERLGEAVRTGAEYAPVTSNVLSADEAIRAGQRGDVVGAITGAIGAVPLPGAAAERAGVGAIERGADGILRHADPAFAEGRIATTTPWSKKLGDAHQSGEGTIGHDTMQASTDMYPKTADIIKEMPYTGVKTKVPAEAGKKAKTVTTWTPTSDLNIPANATPEEAHEAFIEHAKSNILALHDAVPDDIRQGSMQWYDGANTIAKQRAQQYDRPLENIAGTYAALSPQMDWYKNASLGDRVMDISTRQGNTSFSPEMQKWVDGYLKSSSSADTAASAAIFDKIKDKPLGQISDPLERAHWIRAYDEAHNDRAYNIVNPDGTFGAPVQTKGGANAGAGWGSMDAIRNAVIAFEAKDMPTISRAMGGGHKVRNFYNNILNPNAATGDVTIDTHAIAAALLRPLSGSDKDTAIGLGTAPPTNAMTGAKGLYGAYAEAYRRAAAERGILPRQMQSITWEAIRGLYNPVEKRSASFRRGVDEAWAKHRTGEWSQQQVQQDLMVNPDGTSRIREPSWYTGSAIEEPED